MTTLHMRITIFYINNNIINSIRIMIEVNYFFFVRAMCLLAEENAKYKLMKLIFYIGTTLYENDDDKDMKI